MGCLGVCWVWQRQTSQCFLVVSLPSSLPSRNSSRGLWLLFSVTRKPLFKLSKSMHSGMASLTTVGTALFDWPPCSFLSLRSPSVDLGRTQWERFRELFLWFHKPPPVCPSFISSDKSIFGVTHVQSLLPGLAKSLLILLWCGKHFNLPKQEREGCLVVLNVKSVL